MKTRIAGWSFLWLVCGVILGLWAPVRAQDLDLPKPDGGLLNEADDITAFEKRLDHKINKDNLVGDASFESPLPLWFQRRLPNGLFADKLPSKTAHGGGRVLSLCGWSPAGSGDIVSPEVKLEGDNLSASMWVRCRQTDNAKLFESYADKGSSAGRLRLCIFDPKTSAIRITLLDLKVDDLAPDWKLVQTAGIPLGDTDRGTVKIGLLLTGRHQGRTVEIDQLGVFQTARPPADGAVKDNDDTIIVEVETFADGVVWKRVEDYPGWYYRKPSGGAMLAGYHSLKPEQNKPVSKKFEVKTSGPFRLWVRHLTGQYQSFYYVTVLQNGKKMLMKQLNSKYISSKTTYEWRWTEIAGDLKAGPIEIQVSRPPTGASWVNRKIDLIVLTNQMNYTPDADCSDLLPRGYVRFTRTGEDKTPLYCFHVWVRRHAGPNWYANPGILSMAGLSHHYYVPKADTLKLVPGATTPWSRLNQFLLTAGGRNNVSFKATRQSHANGFVYGERIRGTLEFGVERGGAIEVIKKVPVDQESPSVVMTLPADFNAHPDQLLTGFDYVARKLDVIKKFGPAPGPRAKHLEISAILALRFEFNDAKLIRSELDILKRLGFNTLYFLNSDPKDADRLMEENGFLKSHGMMMGLYYKFEDQTKITHEQIAGVEKQVAAARERLAPIVGTLRRNKLADEPGGMPFDTLTENLDYRPRFVEWLKKKDLKLAALGLPLEKYSWDNVRPVGPKEKNELPVLYYYTALWRLECFVDACKASTDALYKYFPRTLKAFVNYSPPLGGGSWVDRATDLFMIHRSGALTMPWSEDWLGYGAGPLQGSYLLAMMRSAGRGQPIGMYSVGVSGGPLLQRIKLYECAAGGAHHISIYNYGPSYGSIDSWSTRYELYPVFYQVLHELGKADPWLFETARRKTDVALLYNRSAQIWDIDDGDTTEREAQFLYWALRHAGFDVDIIPEEDVEEGALSHYKTLYLPGVQIRPAAARTIAAWVEAGGTLFATVGAASRDEFNRPLDTLKGVFGLKSNTCKLVAGAGRPMYETRRTKTLGEVTVEAKDGVPAATFPVLCFDETIQPADGAEVIATFKDRKPAGTLTRTGKGRALRLAALPGLAYIHRPLNSDFYDAEKRFTRLGRDFDVKLRDLIVAAAGMSGAPRVADTTLPLVEFTRYDGKGRSVFFIVNYGLDKVDAFSFVVPDAAAFLKAESARAAAVKLEKLPGGKVRVTLPLDVNDIVVLRAR